MDKHYWRDYYASHRFNAKPSLFAQHILHTYLSDRRSLLELGCGNGRDSMYFATNGIAVTAIDQVQEEIAYLSEYAKAYQAGEDLQEYVESPYKDSKQYKIPHFIAGDFTCLETLPLAREYDCIYSRFTLHSIDKISQDKVLAQSLNICAENGILAIEVRGEKNALYGKGEAVSNEAGAFIYDKHYRRFLNFEHTLLYIQSLVQESKQKAFSNLESKENIALDSAGGGGINVLSLALKFSMPKRRAVLLHLVQKMIILSALSLKRCVAPKNTFISLIALSKVIYSFFKIPLYVAFLSCIFSYFRVYFSAYPITQRVV